MPEKFALDITGCARCDGDGHDGLEFTNFTSPPEWYDENGKEVVFIAWAMCPTLNEPILLVTMEAPDA